jgi:hypothetical protein
MIYYIDLGTFTKMLDVTLRHVDASGNRITELRSVTFSRVLEVHCGERVRYDLTEEVQDPIEHDGIINDQGRSLEDVSHKLVETLIDEQTTKIAEQIRTAYALLHQLNSLRPRENRR